jgi:hypothetical protein
MSQAFQAQFERSGPPSPPSTRSDQTVDGAAALRRFTVGGAPVDAMTGKEMYAIIDMLKAEHGNAGIELESSLLRLKRQLDKKIALLAWVSENISHIAPKPPLADRTNTAALATEMPRPATAPSGAEMRQSSLRGPTVTPATSRVADDTAILQLLNDFAGGEAGLASRWRAGGLRALEEPSMATAPARLITPSQPPLPHTAGRDHLSMTGVEMFDLIGWLKSHGHSEIEDQLIRVRLQGDKKFQLCSCARRPAPDQICIPVTARACAIMGQRHACGSRIPPFPTHSDARFMCNFRRPPEELDTATVAGRGLARTRAYSGDVGARGTV